MKSILINYLRPGKGLTIYEEGFVSEDETCLRTFKQLPAEISERLSASLYQQGLIRSEQRVDTIAKTYFFAEPFNILEFRDPSSNLLGFYSDIGEPAKKLANGEYEMTDLFLDIWLLPDGTLLELDWDEFEDAIERNIINTAQANLARNTMQRLRDEVGQNIYPGNYTSANLQK